MSPRALHAAFVLALVTASAACSRAEPTPPCLGTDAGVPVSPALLAFLSRARAAHHRADLQEDAGDLRSARATLAAILEGAHPEASPELDEVLADTHARLADLASRAGDFGAADGHLSRGLALARSTSYFRGHLFEVKGIVLQRRAEQLAAAGDPDAARAAKEQALAALEESMRIQAQVIEQALPGRPGASPP